MSRSRATALVAFSVCCFGSISVLAVIGRRDGLSLPSLLAWRYLPAAALLALAAGPLQLRRPWREVASAMTLGGLGQALVAVLTLSALRWITAATLAFLFYTYPSWIALFAALRGTERVDRKRAVALALSFAGIAVMVGGPSGVAVASAWPGIVLGIAAALAYAVYVPYLHYLEARTSPAVASTYVVGGAGLACLVAAIAQRTLAVPPSAQSWVAVGALALLCTFVGFLAFLRGLATLGPVHAAIVSTIEPFWTAVLGAVLLGQRLTAGTLIGGALIACAVLMLTMQSAETRA